MTKNDKDKRIAIPFYRFFLKIYYSEVIVVTKNIVFSDGSIKKLTLEELMSIFENMINKFAHRCVHSMSKHHTNTDDFEDFYQYGMLELMKTFNIYNEQQCFSTLLQINLNNKHGYLLRNLNASKRNSNNSTVSLNAEYPEGNTFDTYIGVEDIMLQDIESKIDLLNKLDTLAEEECKIVKNLLEEEKTKIQLAKELGISRPTLDSKIKIIREKLKDLIMY